MSTIITHRQFPGYHKYEMDLAGRPLTLEVGKLAELANAAVMVGYGDTRVLCCVTAAPRPRDGIDFFPLSVDFEEKLYSVGRIPGSFNRREGRPGEKGILTSRVIDRPIRPLFPSDFRNDVSVMCTVMSMDHDCTPEIAALIGTSAALAISDIPWNGPVGALKVGLVDGQLVLNPTSEQRKLSDLDVTVVSTGKKVVMIEAGANEVDEATMLKAIKTGDAEIQKIITFINGIVAEIGKPKIEFQSMELELEAVRLDRVFIQDTAEPYTCFNNRLDGDETDVDCGGALCNSRCAASQVCKANTDCEATASCFNGKCSGFSPLDVGG